MHAMCAHRYLDDAMVHEQSNVVNMADAVNICYACYCSDCAYATAEVRVEW